MLVLRMIGIGHRCRKSIAEYAGSLGLFECKASTVTSAAKYSFNGKLLGDDLEKKFVREPGEKGRLKGVGQLARAVERLQSKERKLLPFGMEPTERA